MTGNTIDTTRVCPNCRALPPEGALVCQSCGISFAAYQTAVYQQSSQTEQSPALADDQPSGMALEHTRRQLMRQLRALLAVAGVVLALALALGALYAEGQRQRRARLDGLYQQGAACATRQDYGCASDALGQLLAEEPAYPDAGRLLADARYGHAQQYARAGQWAAAVEQLDALLAEQPSRSDALVLLRNTYDRWLSDALGRGDLPAALGVGLQRQARFPND